MNSNLTIEAGASLVLTDGSLAINPGKSLSINGTAAFNAKPVTFKSDVTGTARLGVSTGTISGSNINVQRYIPSKRAWRLLSVPVNSTATIFNQWQNGGTYVPGVGTHITAPAGTGNGLDDGLTYSMRTFDVTTQSLVNVSNTNVPLSTSPGYFTFIRGDRDPANLVSPNSNATTLASTGSLVTGAFDKTVMGGTAGTFTLLGNPYVSAINFASLTKTGVADRFYVWDPKLAGVNGAGAYVTFDADLGYIPTVTGGSYTTAPNSMIENGQAFYAVPTQATDGTLGFTEAAKSGSQGNVFKTNGINEIIRVVLNAQEPDNSYAPADGVIAVFNSDYNNSVTTEDAVKLNNISENLAIARSGTLLNIEKRPIITANDTIFLKLWNTSIKNYQFQFNPSAFTSGTTAFLEDSYQNTSTPLSLTGNSNVNFNIDATLASADSNRFRIVFGPSALPVSYIDIKASQKETSVKVDWVAGNESNMASYDLEHSTKGNEFVKLATVKAKANDNSNINYSWTDNNPATGDNYYRIRSTGRNGEIKYSGIAKVRIEQTGRTEITVYPNPISGQTLLLQLNNLAKGQYNIRILNAAGQEVYNSSYQHQGNNGSHSLRIPALAVKGVYNLIISNENFTSSQPIISR